MRELGCAATFLGRELSISQPVVSQAVQRGEILAAERGWQWSDLTIL